MLHIIKIINKWWKISNRNNRKSLIKEVSPREESISDIIRKVLKEDPESHEKEHGKNNLVKTTSQKRKSEQSFCKNDWNKTNLICSNIRKYELKKK